MDSNGNSLLLGLATSALSMQDIAASGTALKLEESSLGRTPNLPRNSSRTRNDCKVILNLGKLIAN